MIGLFVAWAWGMTPQEQADALALQHDDEVQDCMADAARDELTVRFKLRAGELVGYTVVDGDPVAGECLREKLEAWHFSSSLWGPVKALTVRWTPPFADRPLIYETVRAKKPLLRICYQDALARDPGLSGRMKLAWTVEAGKVSDARVLSDDIGDEAMKACVLSMVEGWTFPAGVSARILFPFAFEVRPDPGVAARRH